MSTFANGVLLRTTCVHHPRDGALAGALLDAVARLAAAWRERRRRARVLRGGARALAQMSERDLADIGLTVYDVRRPGPDPWAWTEGVAGRPG